MNRIRLLPVVVMAIAALLVLKTLGLVTNGGYVLTGVTMAQASGASSGGGEGGTTEADQTLTPTAEPTLEDTSPTLSDTAPTIGEPAAAAEGGGHGATATEAPANEAAPAAPAGEAAAVPPEGEAAAAGVTGTGAYCFEADATLTEGGEVVLEQPAADAAGETSPESNAEHGSSGSPQTAPLSFAAAMADCLPSGDAVPTEISDQGQIVPLANTDGTTPTEAQLLERLAARRAELQQYEQDLTLRASIVDAAEKRIAERATTLEALEAQISALVDQRTEMEAGQFAGIVSMYEAMKPKDAATIFNNLDMDVLLRVAKTMSPRKMAPILAAMDAPRAQELTVKMAALADKPATEMTPDDLAALPQIVGQ